MEKKILTVHFFCMGPLPCRGVGILIPNDISIEIKILSNVSDSNGRILILDCEIEDRPLVIINVYAPTKDDVRAQNRFLEELVALIEPYSDKPLLPGGDFNIYFNSIDKNGGIIDKESSYRCNFLNIMTEYSLVDIWIIRNKKLSQFTWRGKGREGLVQSRIDFWLISSSFEYEVDKCLLQPGLLSEHSILILSLNLLQTQRRGRGTWKFNNTLLKDFEYIALIKKTIQQVQEHSVSMNKSTRWEYLKCQM